MAHLTFPKNRGRGGEGIIPSQGVAHAQEDLRSGVQGVGSQVSEEKEARLTWLIEPSEGGTTKLKLLHESLTKEQKEGFGFGWAFRFQCLKNRLEERQAPKRHRNHVAVAKGRALR